MTKKNLLALLLAAFPPLGRLLKRLIRGLRELYRGLFSADRPTRKMSVLFFCALGTLVFIIGKVVFHSDSVPQVQPVKAPLVNKPKLEAEHDIWENQVSLGPFIVELKESPAYPDRKGMFHLAELEIVALCETPECRLYVNNHLTELRSQLVQVFVPLDPQQLMSKEGKKKLRAQMIHKLNEKIPESKIKDLYITKLLLN